MIKINVVTYNAIKVLKKCIESVFSVAEPMPFKLCIYDNGSTDGTGEWLTKNAATGYEFRLLGANLGFPAAANIAFRETIEDVIVFLDDDVEVVPGWLSHLFGAMNKSPQIGIVSSKIIDPNGNIFFAEIRTGPLRSLRRGETDYGQGAYTKDTDVVPGTCWMMRRELFDSIGGFDENYYPCQFEDFDYCLRARLAGYRVVYDGTLTLIHHNLYRTGGKQVNEKNRDYFYKKLGKELEKFPLPDSDPVDRKMSRAIQLIDSKDFLAALEILDSVRSINADYVDNSMLFLALWESGRQEEAKILGEELLRLNPLNFFIRFKLGKAGRSADGKGISKEHAERLLDAVEKQKRKFVE